jgi:hypothetical protein
MSKPNAPINAAVVAGQLAKELESRGQEYAIGGAIALGYWGSPRGTVDVDLTIAKIWQMSSRFCGRKAPNLIDSGYEGNLSACTDCGIPGFPHGMISYARYQPDVPLI